jgi:hypothetical protein
MRGCPHGKAGQLASTAKAGQPRTARTRQLGQDSHDRMHTQQGRAASQHSDSRTAKDGEDKTVRSGQPEQYSHTGTFMAGHSTTVAKGKS